MHDDDADFIKHSRIVIDNHGVFNHPYYSRRQGLEPWRPGESVIPQNMPVDEWGIYSEQFHLCYDREVVQATDAAIYKMMGEI